MIVSLFVEYSKIIVLINTIYSNTETPSFWGRSEKIGFAVTECRGGNNGVLEYWKPVLVEGDLF